MFEIDTDATTPENTARIYFDDRR